MNIIGKYRSIRGQLHVAYLRWKNKNADFTYVGEILSPKVNIAVERNSIVKIQNIWGGAGAVILKVVDNGKLIIGKNVCINANCYFVCREKIVIGDDVMFGPNVVVFDHDHDYKNEKWKDMYKTGEIVIGNNVWIGANVTILRNTHIGDNCVVGAGTVIKGDYAANTVIINSQQIITKEFKRQKSI